MGILARARLQNRRPLCLHTGAAAKKHGCPRLLSRGRPTVPANAAEAVIQGPGRRLPYGHGALHIQALERINWCYKKNANNKTDVLLYKAGLPIWNLPRQTLERALFAPPVFRIDTTKRPAGCIFPADFVHSDDLHSFLANRVELSFLLRYNSSIFGLSVRTFIRYSKLSRQSTATKHWFCCKERGGACAGMVCA